MTRKTRPIVLAGKRVVSWRINDKLLALAEQEQKRLGFKSLPAFIHFLLEEYFLSGKK